MHRSFGRIITWGIWRIHHWKPKVDKNEAAVLIRKPLLSQIRREIIQYDHYEEMCQFQSVHCSLLYGPCMIVPHK